VSFQGNKGEPFYRWFRYKEGFSYKFVRYCLDEIGSKPGTLLDPFAGAGAALFASRDLGWNAIGIEVLPVGVYAIIARLSAEQVNAATFAKEVHKLKELSFADWYDPGFAFRHIPITEGAFCRATARALAGYMAYCKKSVRDVHVRRLLEFACFCVLEEVSYTRKDGQYLRWDHRSPKNRAKRKFDKGDIPSFRRAVLAKAGRIAEDIANAPYCARLSGSRNSQRGYLDVRAGSCLAILPELQSGSVDFVLTSPPYCNRYDYTRTYALELAFLGHDATAVKQLRQTMLSCTVENRAKLRDLAARYATAQGRERLRAVDNVFRSQQALCEILEALDHCKQFGKLNNANIPRMVRNYFYEMCFAIAEIARILRERGTVVMVNDNVRYAGEEVPVDLILSDFAVRFGLRVRHIWYLPRGKGNSSQQMGLHGREELRKSVYVWEKAT
jgi:hypothetical protein